MKEFLTFVELMNRIIACPADFIPNPSLPKIRCFIEGYDFATNGLIHDREFYRTFSDWVTERFAMKSAHDWEMIISFEAGNERDSLDVARNLWRVYLRTGRGLLGSPEKYPVLRKSDLVSDTSSQIFEKLQIRPTLYVGHVNIRRIKAFLDGFRFAKGFSDNLADDLVYDGFSGWVADRLKLSGSHEWDAMVAFMAPSEDSSFKLMKELWKEYKAEADENQLHC